MKDKSAVSDCKYTPHYHRDRSNVTKINITDYGKDAGLTAEVRSIVHGNNCALSLIPQGEVLKVKALQRLKWPKLSLCHWTLENG